MKVTYTDVINAFHSRFTDRYEVPEALEEHWFAEAVSEFELEVYSLEYDTDTQEFGKELPALATTLGTMMYVRYLTKELSRVLKLNGIMGKDLSITGGDGTKRVTNQELIAEREQVSTLLYKYKENALG